MSVFAWENARAMFATRGNGSSRRGGWFAFVFAGTIALLLSSCQAQSQPSGDVSKGPGPGDAVQLVAEDSAFVPSTLELPAGDEVTIEVTNDDTIPHDFTIESIDLSTGVIEAGDVTTVTFTVPDSETEFLCTLHSRMTGRIEPK